MKPFAIACLAGVLAALGACTTTRIVHVSSDGSDAGSDDPGDPDDPANQPPHSLGTIMLGEVHVAGSGSSSPIVGISFVPDAVMTRACKKKLDESCEIIEHVKCTDDEDSMTGCGAEEVCVLDDDCTSTCKKIPVCSMDCEEEEICTLSKSGKAICAKSEAFDAGPIAFSGTTTSITLHPPYVYESDGKGAPFLAGAEIVVQAQGAVEAGFEAFEETFTATTFIQPSPTLNKVPREKVFGTGALPLTWKPGADVVLITLQGPGGAVTCKANDAEGTFDVPRAVIDAALGEPNEYRTPTLSLSVSRQRKETRKGYKAKGELSQVTVQPEGWLDLVTLSTEATSFIGCAGTEAVCGNECTDLMSDPQNCGSCGKACGNGTVCAGGKCVDIARACESCHEGTKVSTCKAEFDACKESASCSSLSKCVEPCTTESCVDACLATYPDGESKLVSFYSCAFNACREYC